MIGKKNKKYVKIKKLSVIIGYFCQKKLLQKWKLYSVLKSEVNFVDKKY